MKPLDEVPFHPLTEQLVNILCTRTQNTNPMFFRVHVAYYWALVASMMRCNLLTKDRGKLPVNLYAINLSTSGSGKGYSTNIMEEQVLAQFIARFTEETFPLMAEMNLPLLANNRAIRKSTDPDEELERCRREFDSQGPLVISFDSGTTAAVRQARHKLLMVNGGSMNLQIDEIGSNLMGNVDVLSTFLELYDVGRIKTKLIKNTAENIRHEEISGRTPTNMMLFGTPSRLLNGGKSEDEFYAMLDTGYARRCFFSYSREHTLNLDRTPQEVLAERLDSSAHSFLEGLADHFGTLADMSNVNKDLPVQNDVTLLFIEYQLDCARRAANLPDHDEMRKAEIVHRHSKALRLAGAYAFVDNAAEVTMDHAYQAIKLTEESGKAFDQLLTRDRPYVKLAKYIANIGRGVTQADLVEDLPFYRGAASQKQEMMQLAIAYGYQNNILIKKMFSDGVEFLHGESLKLLDLSKIIISYSDDIALGYTPEYAPFDKLHMLTQLEDMHWVNHHLKGGHRSEEDAVPGFNIIVIDVDGEISLEQARLYLQDYTCMFYTTKRHTETENRFRIIMPIAYELKLDAKDYKEFMANIFAWLPFEVDAATNQRARKWLTHQGYYAYQDGEILNPLPFIPKTAKNEERKRTLQDQQALDSLERWVLNNSGDGNRNNMLLKYAMLLVDSGFTFNDVHDKVMSLNDKMPDKLDQAEILGTILKTAAKAIAGRED